ncbi:hypothetical protein NUW58_g5481 [Xylaria curta]|uniref:Uncharacterized protein n=1 Tax=Xylaria curta TaxID=42375 RepID=A0ACC1P242_9PEZI|nr:hypothetical protein NUW58_g5481 [Xylaria curta]
MECLTHHLPDGFLLVKDFLPGGPGPWNSYGYPPGPQGPPGTPGQGMRATPQPESKPAPIGAGVDKQKPVGIPAAEVPIEPKNFGQRSSQPTPNIPAPTPPVESKPTAAEVKATADSLATNKSVSNKAETKSVPSGPRSSRITPAVPTPAAILSRSGPQAVGATPNARPAAEQSNGPSGPAPAPLRDATEVAKAAVAAAMAALDNPNAAIGTTIPTTGGNSVDNLTKKVNEMRVNATRGGSGRGRGRGGRGGAQSKVEVPDADFDFQTANAKFNKQELAKEAVSSPTLGETPNGAASETPEPEDGAYNKTRSFFDNIGSEAKERAENGGQKPGGREWRGEEDSQG